MKLKERFRGSMLGLAAGDAVGTTNEFCKPEKVIPISDMVGGGVFKLRPGEWTDDTSMALCLAQSLVEKKGFDAKDQMDLYTLWYDCGHLSSNGDCFDIGGTVLEALESYRLTSNPYAGSSDPKSSGNGSLMRLAPVVLFYAKNVNKAMQMAAKSSQTTHGSLLAIDACRYFARLLVMALHGESKAKILSSHWKEENFLTNEVYQVASGSFKEKSKKDILGTGYVISSLEAALWAFYNSDTFKDGCLLTANLGNDADSTSAIYGQLAGAYYGERGIPASWRNKLAKRQVIEYLADCLYELAR